MTHTLNEHTMQICHVVIKVDDQDKALAFYTTILGFVKKLDFSGAIRYLTVVSPEGEEGCRTRTRTKPFPGSAGIAEGALRCRLSGHHISDERHRRRIQAFDESGCQVSRGGKENGAGNFSILRRYLWQPNRLKSAHSLTGIKEYVQPSR